MSFICDENISPRIARALKALGEPIVSVVDVPTLGRGTIDEVLIPYCGKNELTLITLDRRIKTTPQLHTLLHEFEVGAFFVYSGTKKSPPTWPIVQSLVKHWPEVRRLDEQLSRPFSRLLKTTGGIQDFSWSLKKGRGKKK